MSSRRQPQQQQKAAAPPPVSPRSGFALPSTAEELHHAKSRWSEDAWQMKLLKLINSDKIQKFFLCLLFLDVLIIFIELALDAFFPTCHFIIRDAISCCPAHEDDELNAGINVRRILESDSTDHHDNICTPPLIDTDYQAGCDEHKYQRVHVTHNVLFWLTVVILLTFEVEFSLLIYLLGPKKFLHQVIYIVDLIIVSTSLALELTFHFRSNSDAEILPGILIVFRLWRFVRIGHGLLESTYEMHMSKMHLALEYIELLEDTLKGYDGELPERPKKLKSEFQSEHST